jgi:hypothetical protein
VTMSDLYSVDYSPPPLQVDEPSVIYLPPTVT